MDGYAFPDTVSQPDILIAGNKHDRILIRLCNLGRMRQSIHYHDDASGAVLGSAQTEIVVA